MADRGYRGRPQRGERADRQINAGHSRGLDAALGFGEQLTVGGNNVERLVGKHHHLVQIGPCVVERTVVGGPLVLVHGVPEATVIPVATAYGDDGFVGGEGVVVVDATAGALQSLALFGSPDVVVEGGNGIDIDVLGRGIEGGFVHAVLGMFVKAGGEAHGEQQNQGQKLSLVHRAVIGLRLKSWRAETLLRG